MKGEKGKTNGEDENEWGNERKQEKQKEHFEGSMILGRMEFNISKIQQSLDVWNLIFQRFSPASTLALDI
ncbi:unnamed protein product [Rhizophagus irregularis]|nr:unnamed protein product [Rhizophagus irregularis]